MNVRSFINNLSNSNMSLFHNSFYISFNYNPNESVELELTDKLQKTFF